MAVEIILLKLVFCRSKIVCGKDVGHSRIEIGFAKLIFFIRGMMCGDNCGLLVLIVIFITLA